MNTLRKSWKDWTPDELANDADTGTRGQGAVVEASRRLMVATQSAGDCASVQTAEVIKLTRALRIYTIALAIMGAIQIGVMFWK